MSAKDNLSSRFLDLYHHTTPEKAAKIRAEGNFESIDPQGRVFLGNVPHGFYGADYGQAAVHVRIPAHEATEVDSFRNGEKFYTVPRERLGREHLDEREAE